MLHRVSPLLPPLAPPPPPVSRSLLACHTTAVYLYMHTEHLHPQAGATLNSCPACIPVTQSWNNEAVKEYEFLDPAEQGLAGVTLANVIIYSQKLTAGNIDYLLGVPRSTFIQNRKGAYGLRYTSTLADGSPLPSWLNFDEPSLELSASFCDLEGWDNLSNVTNSEGEWEGSLDVVVTAIDPLGANASITIPFVLNWRAPPAVVQPMADLSVEWGTVQTIQYPSDAFQTFQAWAPLTYNLTVLKVRRRSSRRPLSRCGLCLQAQPCLMPHIPSITHCPAFHSTSAYARTHTTMDP